MAGLVFQTEPNLSFTAGLARWLSQPKEPLLKAGDEAADEAATSPSSAFEAECVALEGSGDFAQLSAKLSEKLKELFSTADEAALHSAYTIYFQLLVQWELLAPSVEALADGLCSSPTERAALRRSLLVSLYALVQQYGLTDKRFAVLVRLIKFAAAAQQLKEVFGAKEGRIAAMERWIVEWKLDEPQVKELWGLFYDAHCEDSGLVYSYALKYLSLFAAADLSANAELRQRLVSAVLRTIRSPSVFQCDELAQLPAVKQLEHDSEHAMLYRLMVIFARETFVEYSAFQSSAEGAAFFAKHGLEHEASSKKMRLLSIVSLGQKEKELSYAAIAAAIKVDEADVEVWVMEAIGAGLIGAKMDQVAKTVYVSVTIEREFAAQQWKRLHVSLSDWRDSIRGLLNVIQGSRPPPGN